MAALSFKISDSCWLLMDYIQKNMKIADCVSDHSASAALNGQVSVHENNAVYR